jgi:hypothetical protein
MVDYSFDSNLFSVLNEEPKVVAKKHNYCPNCNIPYTYSQLSASMYECSQCGGLKELHGLVTGENDNQEVRMGPTRTVIDGRHSVYSGGHQDYKKVQRKIIMEQLIRLNIQSATLKLSLDIMENVVCTYNGLQQIEVQIEVYDAEKGSRQEKKKFIKRKTVKDEILAAIVHLECIRAKEPVTKRLVAQFMQLGKGGFSRGEKILKDMIGPDEGRDEASLAIDMINKYLDCMSISYSWARDFVKDIIDRSEELYIGYKSTKVSRVVGAIWLLCKYNGAIVNQDMVERKCDGVKRATFEKFSSAIEAELIEFKDIFEKYSVPHGLKA